MVFVYHLLNRVAVFFAAEQRHHSHEYVHRRRDDNERDHPQPKILNPSIQRPTERGEFNAAAQAYKHADEYDRNWLDD